MGMSLEAWLPAKLPGQEGFGGQPGGRGAVEAVFSDGDGTLALSLLGLAGVGGKVSLEEGQPRSPLKPTFLLSAPRGSWASASQGASEGPRLEGGSRRGWKARAGPWALSAHFHLSSRALSDRVFSLSSPAPVPLFFLSAAP